MNNIKLTIFTPVYNREEELIRLFNSLKSQSNMNFIWLIVDDGSNKSTKSLVEEFRSQCDFQICFIYQENQGKHIAHNTAVLNCETEYFMCVDSDDTLSSDAVEIIYHYLPKLEKKFIGIIAPRNEIYETNQLNYNEFETKLVQIIASRKHAIELAIIFKTSLLKKYLFPKYGEERFLSEEILYNELDKIGVYIFINKVIYYSEYQNDGLTKNINKLWINNPMGTYELLRSRYNSFDSLSLKDKLYRKVRCTLVYDAFCIKKNLKNILRFPNRFLAIICLPLSYFVYLKKFKQERNI